MEVGKVALGMQKLVAKLKGTEDPPCQYQKVGETPKGIEYLCNDGRLVLVGPETTEVYEPDTARTVVRSNSDGKVVKYVYDDGRIDTPGEGETKKIQLASGLTIEKREDGSAVISYDGKVIGEISPEGVKTITEGDTTTKTYPDGRVETQRELPNGVIIHKYADAEQSYIDRIEPLLGQQITTRYYDDGRVEINGRGDKTGVLEAAPGTMIKGNKKQIPYGDGTMLVVYNSGKKALLFADGSTEDFLSDNSYLDKLKASARNSVFR